MWTIAAVNKKFEGPLGSYNGLTDVHLAHFFSQPSRQSHLKSAKLITKDGFIVPEKNVKGEVHLHEKKRKVYDILARSILQNAVHEEGSWNKKLCNYLEDISKMTAVDKARKTMKKKSSRVASELLLERPFSYNIAYENDILRSPSKSTYNYINLPKPPNSAPVTCGCFIKEGQQKIAKLKVHYKSLTVEYGVHSIHHPFTGTYKKNWLQYYLLTVIAGSVFSVVRSLSAKQHSPYGIPLILSGSYKEQMQSLFDNNKTVKQKKRKQRKLINSVGNSNIIKNILSMGPIKVSVPYQALKLSQCQITMLYHGHLHLTNFQKSLTQNILIKQQHCGGTPVVIYKGKISANEFLSFITLDHEGFFFSLTMFINGIRELKLSSCCVFRYLPGRRLGGPNGTFSIKKIEGGKPCLKCQYQEYENNEFRVISQSSRISVDNSINLESSHVPENDVKDDSDDKASSDNYKPPSPDEAIIEANDESKKMTDTESHADDEIEELLDEGVNQDNKEEVSPEDSIADERSASSDDVDEIKENEDSDGSISSENQSEISEKIINDEQKKYQSVDTSSEEEGEIHHIVTASVHKIPEDN